MKIDEFKKLIQKLENKNLSGRHLYIWNLDESNLYSFILENYYDKLDISCVCGEFDKNIDDDREIKKELLRELDNELKKWYNQNKKNILIVNSIYLLVRYNISLNIFYNYLSDNKMIILQIKNYYYQSKLPGYVEYDPEYILNTIIDVIGENKILEE